MIKGEQNNSRTTCCGEGGGWRVNKEIALRYVLKTRCQCVVQQIGISAFTGTEDPTSLADLEHETDEGSNASTCCGSFLLNHWCLMWQHCC